jgi:hypothetical protein
MLALIALVLWAGSFSLTAIVTLYATKTLEMMPAWMTNPLLLWIGILVLLGRSSARYAPLMVLCVFGTPFIWTLTGDAGGIPFRDIVGYGWGAVRKESDMRTSVGALAPSITGHRHGLQQFDTISKGIVDINALKALERLVLLHRKPKPL